MNTQALPPRRQPEGKLAFHVERGPQWRTVALQGEASFDQAEVIAAQLLRIRLDGYSLVVFDLAELTFISPWLWAPWSSIAGACRGAASRARRRAP
jgi:hypothetical protein